MKEWTKEEIDSVCELVGGNPDEIIRQLQSRLEELNQKVTALQQENASLKQDAARYRWLRSGDRKVTEIEDLHLDVYLEDELDEAIDTAMQSNNQ